MESRDCQIQEFGFQPSVIGNNGKVLEYRNDSMKVV